MAAQLNLQVFVRVWGTQYTWAKVKAVRNGLWRPCQCPDREAPYTRIRWGRP